MFDGMFRDRAEKKKPAEGYGPAADLLRYAKAGWDLGRYACSEKH